MSIPVFRSSFLVIGTGVAGLTFALRASEHGTVNLVTKKDDFESNTNYAQGGIAAVFDKTDSFEAHIQDTLTAGAGLCHVNAVKCIVENGPDVIRELMELGANFTRQNDGGLELGREGGHSFRRIVHSKDLTGREVERALLAKVRATPNIRVFEHHLGVDLVVDENRRCWGGWVFDARNRKIDVFLSGTTVVCTGGCGRVYFHSTNPSTATGDGIAMAFRKGARVANMEFMQFHPTAYYDPSEPRPFLITEAVRGEGAILRAKDGDAFMARYHEMKDLAPRDIVARAIDNEMKKRGDVCCYLDVTHLNLDFFEERFPAITDYCKKKGLNLSVDFIPIVPAAHYSCGGVVTGEHGETDIRGLYAAGEVAFTGVHGANRLASNSILEALVYSKFAVKHAVDTGVFREESQEIPESPFKTERRTPIEAVRFVSSSKTLRQLMWDYVGIVRSTERLQIALKHVQIIRSEMESYADEGYIHAQLLELRNLSLIAELIIRSALNRKESRGLHYNVDYPDLSTEKMDTIAMQPSDSGIHLENTSAE